MVSPATSVSFVEYKEVKIPQPQKPGLKISKAVGGGMGPISQIKGNERKGKSEVNSPGLVTKGEGKPQITFPAFFNNTSRQMGNKSPMNMSKKLNEPTVEKVKHVNIGTSLPECNATAINFQKKRTDPLVEKDFEQPIRVQSVLEPTREHHIQLNLDVASSIQDKDSQKQIEFQHVITKHETISREVSLAVTPDPESPTLFKNKDSAHSGSVHEHAYWTNAKNKVLKFGEDVSTLKKNIATNDGCVKFNQTSGDMMG